VLAERLPPILPDLADDDALTVTAIRSVVADVQGLWFIGRRSRHRTTPRADLDRGRAFGILGGPPDVRHCSSAGSER
jgi:hypothetical protein